MWYTIIVLRILNFGGDTVESINADIFLVRHAQSCENSGEKYTPEFTPDDAPLSELGKRQSQALAERFACEDIDMIFASTLIRTVQTMQPTAKKLGKPIIMLPELMEAETEICGTPPEKVLSLVPEAVLPSYELFLPVPETPEQMQARAEKAVSKTLSLAGDNCRIIATSHHDFFPYLIRAFLGLSLPAQIRWSVYNASVTHIRLRKNKLPELVYLNDTSHLLTVK